MYQVHAYAALKKGGELSPFEFSLGDLASHEVDIHVDSCGICHSDLSMLDGEWNMSVYPLVPGHEVIGTVVRKGNDVHHLEIGQVVGLGWYSKSCLHCHNCLDGDQNLCSKAEQTIVGRYGGFADYVRCSGEWAIPLPEGIDAKTAGPLFCGGITVFNPIVQFGVLPTHRVGVIGIGGLGHLALQFLNKWGCEVTAFTSNPGKIKEAKQLGAHHVVQSTDNKALQKLTGKFDFILNASNADFDWNVYLQALGPRGRLHTVGIIPNPVPIPAFTMIQGQKSFSGSPLGSPATIQDMLAFCARHQIAPITEFFKMSDVNKALQHLREGKARYRIILES